MNSNEIDIHKELKKYFGFSQFKGLQEQVIQSLLAGQNTFVIMPTGGGKSLCYQLPALTKEGTAIVVSPLIALMQDQVAALRQLGITNQYVSTAACASAANVLCSTRRDALARQSQKL